MKDVLSTSPMRKLVNGVIVVSQYTLSKVLNGNRLHPFYFQRVKYLNAENYHLRLNVCQWVLQQWTSQPYFTGFALFTDETMFTPKGVFNGNNFQLWATRNIHTKCGRNNHYVWMGASIVKAGPYLLQKLLKGLFYLIFLEQILPDLLQDFSITICNRMWFQHDEVPAHFSTRAYEIYGIFGSVHKSVTGVPKHVSLLLDDILNRHLRRHV